MPKRKSLLRTIIKTLLGLDSWTAQSIAALSPAKKLHLARKHLHATAALDIETTGFSPTRDEVTVIGLHHLGDDSGQAFVQGRNLEDFFEALEGIELLVTYNGDRFDLPFIRQTFGACIQIPHIDLMPVLRAYGYTGGQKAIERRLGLSRTDSGDVDGRMAVWLWNRYEEEGDEEALEQLVDYNLEDCRMLAEILRIFCGIHG